MGATTPAATAAATPAADSPPAESVLVHVADGIGRLLLNRPESGNAFDQAQADAFRDAAVALAQDGDIRVIVVEARGKLFCAGGDVSAMNAAAEPGSYAARLAETITTGLLALERSPAVVVAAVQGAAAGAGLALVLAADLVLSAPRAVYLSAYAGVGLVPDCGVSRRLPECVGPRRALELVLTGRVLTAADALEWGLITEVVADVDDLETRVQQLSTQLAAGPGLVLGASKRLLRERSATYEQHLAAEGEGLEQMLATEETRALLAAFVARRSSR